VDGGETPVDDAKAEPLEAPLVSGTADSEEHRLEPPVLTEKVDFELPGDAEDVAGNALSVAATLQPESPAQPDEEQLSGIEAFEDLAAETHLHEISDSMAERLFSADSAATAVNATLAATPLESGDIEQPPERTAVVRQLAEDFVPESEENQADPDALAPTMVY